MSPMKSTNSMLEDFLETSSKSRWGDRLTEKLLPDLRASAEAIRRVELFEPEFDVEPIPLTELHEHLGVEREKRES